MAGEGGEHVDQADHASLELRAAAACDDEAPLTTTEYERAPDVTPSPSLVGLCHAYSAAVATANGKALDNRASSVLITTAGGKAAVAAYCTKLLATALGGKPTSLPTQARSHKPATHPTGAPVPHPTGRP